ncbi:uncharacterized protein LOC127750338 [Frankliniella occidentalis]|uniref:Uncharacterized protein LOC127750338 n=1 Tax=Frankliniella occidentalis TaxID=133901 RepID=A0A9C6X275_FRAOC|nr:uncharacterized protein LOC127750338 [Frankliniella occidentalis]
MPPVLSKHKTKRGGDCVAYNGYMYHYHSANPKRTRKYWRCELRKQCNARITTNFAAVEVLLDGTAQHQHQPAHAEVEVREVVSAIRQRALDDPGVAPEAIIRSELRNVVDPEVQMQLPERPALRRMVNRAQNAARPGMPTNLQDIVIVAPYTRTASGERFLHYDSGPGDEERILMFTTKENLRILCMSIILFADGTFKTVPNMFLQMYSIHGEFRDNIFPLVFCLTVRKSEDTYRRMYSELIHMCEQYHFHLQPEIIMQDFELAAMNAAKALFPNVQIKGCLFHFSQSIWRKVASAGLRDAFVDRDDSTIRDNFRELVGLAFVPIAEVEQRFDEIKGNMHRDMEPVVKHLEKTYIRGEPPRRPATRRRNPAPRPAARFPPNTWNVYDLVLTGKQRTNNNVEGWHGHFQRMVVAHHLNLWRFLGELQKEQHDIELKRNQLLGGHKNIKEPLPATQKRNHAMIERIVGQYDIYIQEGRLEQYLRGISYRLKVNTAVLPDSDDEEED